MYDPGTGIGANSTHVPWYHPPRFTALDLSMGFIMLIVVAALLYFPISKRAAWVRADNAARVVAGDLRQAVLLANRQGIPLRVEFDAPGMTIRVLDDSGRIVRARAFGKGTDLPLASATSAPASVQVFPNRTTSGSMVITLTTSARSNRVVISRDAVVRVEGL